MRRRRARVDPSTRDAVSIARGARSPFPAIELWDMIADSRTDPKCSAVTAAKLFSKERIFAPRATRYRQRRANGPGLRERAFYLVPLELIEIIVKVIGEREGVARCRLCLRIPPRPMA